MEYSLSQDYIDFLLRTRQSLISIIEKLDKQRLSSWGYQSIGFYKGQLYMIEEILDELEIDYSE